METKYTVNVYIREKKEEQELKDFDYSALLEEKNGDTDINLPPPIMTINETMDESARIMISFNRPINFKLPQPKRAL